MPQTNGANGGKAAIEPLVEPGLNRSNRQTIIEKIERELKLFAPLRLGGSSPL